MHPAIRIVDCLFLILMLASGIPLALIFSAGIIVSLMFFCYINSRLPDITVVWRLRWLFASILILYLAFPPVASVGWQQQLTAGLGEAGRRIVALVGIVVLVQILFAMTERRRVLAGLLWILRPFSRVGLPVERFALRLMLVMEVVPAVQRLLQQDDDGTARDRSTGRLDRLAKRLTAAYGRVVEHADHANARAIQIPELGAPAVYEWLSPCLLAGLAAGILIAG